MSLTLSYSSKRLIQSCENKYFHYKVASTPVDPDHEESGAFDIGKAFHQYLEDNKHQKVANFDKEVLKACAAHEVEQSDIPMIKAMLLKYLDLHEASGLEVVKCEQEILTDKFRGYIDAIMKNPLTGDWWIVDLKTAAKWDEGKLASLAHDEQLNLYSYFSDKLAPIFDLSPEKFMGARYRVTTKTTASIKKGEVEESFVQRLYTMNVKSFDIVIPVSVMNREETWSSFLEAYDRITELHAGVAPRKNRGVCMEYFKPCQYWSQCYGKTFTEAKNSVQIFSESSFGGDLL